MKPNYKSQMKKTYADIYSFDFVLNIWTEISMKRFVRTIQKYVPDISEDEILKIFYRDSVDCRCFDFELADWIKYFKDKEYLK